MKKYKSKKIIIHCGYPKAASATIINEMIKIVKNHNVVDVNEDPDLLNTLFHTGKKIYLKINLDTIDNEQALLDKIEKGQVANKIVICKSRKSNNETLLKSLLHYTENEQIINGFNLDLNQIDLWPAIEIKATAEGKPGYKDYGEVMDILEYIDDQE